MLTTLANGKTVWGIAAVGNKLFVLRDRHGGKHSYIDAYDAETFSRVPTPRHFPRFRGATDLAASARHACLYVGDEMARSVFKVGLLAGLDEWTLMKHKPWGVSVTFRDNVLVTLYDVNVVLEMRADGEHVRQIHLAAAGIVHSQHALHASANRLIVCHATSRISVVDSDGTPIQSRGGSGDESGQPEHGPCYLAADQNNLVYATDVLYRRIAVYSPALDFVGEVVGHAELNWWPTRLLVDGVRRRLYVADNNFDGQKYTAGRVVVFSLR